MQERSDHWFEPGPKVLHAVGSQDIDWFVELPPGADDAATRPALRKIYDGIQSSLAAGDFDLLDFVLERAEPQRLNTAYIVGLLRYTYAARNRLLHWRTFLDKAIDVLDNREGVDRRSILRGLHADGRAQIGRQTVF